MCSSEKKRSKKSITRRVTDTARGVLAITKEERAQLATAIQHAGAQVLPLAQRLEPESGELARYLILPEEPGLVASISNDFTANVTGVLGSERAEIFLVWGWQQLKSSLPLVGPERATMIVCQTTEGQPKLVCHVRQNGNTTVSEVRFAHIPAGWFNVVFPGGWRELATREGFELPKDFEKGR